MPNYSFKLCVNQFTSFGIVGWNISQVSAVLVSNKPDSLGKKLKAKLANDQIIFDEWSSN